MDGWQQIKAYNTFDGCKFGDFYPDLRNLSSFAVDRLAKDTAKLYCAQDIIGKSSCKNRTSDALCAIYLVALFLFSV